jgi:hypothetical protein
MAYLFFQRQVFILFLDLQVFVLRFLSSLACLHLYVPAPGSRLCQDTLACLKRSVSVLLVVLSFAFVLVCQFLSPSLPPSLPHLSLSRPRKTRQDKGQGTKGKGRDLPALGIHGDKLRHVQYQDRNQKTKIKGRKKNKHSRQNNDSFICCALCCVAWRSGVLLCCVVSSCLALPCLVLACLSLPCLLLSCLLLSCLLLSCLALLLSCNHPPCAGHVMKRDQSF